MNDPFVLAGASVIPEFNQLGVQPAIAGVLVADHRKGHGLGAGQEICQLVDGG